ncbi:hypothetical protein A7P96_06310 [Eikenella sp. NML03-A-027]|uniref:uracil-DNA glycosylase n=1 Tax=Eikenella sp. NML03-A-027 TaxID=1795828 RepID=UPI0007DF3C26|nr:hypothetical protein A7P96_06310 [Eikenella sp. NML03-A-027]
MLSSRYPRLHEALGLGPMWLKRSARIAENTRPESQRLPENERNDPRPSGHNALQPNPPHSITPAAQPRLPESERGELRQIGAGGLQQHPNHTLAPNQPAARTTPPPQGHRADVLAAMATSQPLQPTPTQTDNESDPLAAVQRLWAALPPATFANIEELQQQAAACATCSLHSQRKQALSGYSAIPARLMVISLNPAPSDDETGRLISGRHGRLLDNMLAAIGLAPEQVFRTAWLRCTPRIALKATPEEQVHCAAFIRQEFAWAQPQAVLLLGNSFYDPARRWLLEQLIGHTPAFTVPHPAILLRQPELKAQAWHSLKQLKAALAKA